MPHNVDQATQDLLDTLLREVIEPAAIAELEPHGIAFMPPKAITFLTVGYFLNTRVDWNSFYCKVTDHLRDNPYGAVMIKEGDFPHIIYDHYDLELLQKRWRSKVKTFYRSRGGQRRWNK